MNHVQTIRLAPLADCDWAAPAQGPAGLTFMVFEGEIVRADVQDSSIATAEGARVGDSEERITQLYPGRVTVRPHKYTDGKYLIITPMASTDTLHRILFETDGSVVTRFRSGMRPQVGWVEGCA